MEKIDKAIEILQAFKEGKTIEYRNRLTLNSPWSKWEKYTSDLPLSLLYYVLDVNTDFRIVSKCQEPIDETELNTLAEQYESSLPDSYTWNEQCDDGEGIHGVCSVCEIEKAFKAGYKKAKE